MVDEQLIARRIHDPRVIEALGRIERHAFVPEQIRERSYDDTPLPIGQGQTISQPYIVAYMTESLGLRGTEKVLEIGTGSGYQTAVLASLAKTVYSVERIKQLSVTARHLLEDLGFSNIMLKVADGSYGWQEHAPFDRIIVTAATPEMPDPLVEQLAEGGSCVVPLGGRSLQILTLIEKREGKVISRQLCECVFVPLIGAYGAHHFS